MDGEIWMDIPNYEGYYKVSNLGRVKSLERMINYARSKNRKLMKEHILFGSVNSNGYKTVNLCKDGYYKHWLIHRLVMLSFVGESDLRVNHIDENKLNNRLDNLEYITSRGNVIYSIDKEKTTSKYTGVCWSKTNSKWVAQRFENNKRHFLGYYESEYDAHLAYINFDIKKHKPRSSRFNTKYKGVNYYKHTNSWLARIIIDSKRIFLGYFKTEQDAINACIAKKMELLEKYC